MSNLDNITSGIAASVRVYSQYFLSRLQGLFDPQEEKTAEEIREDFVDLTQHAAQVATNVTEEYEGDPQTKAKLANLQLRLAQVVERMKGIQ